MPFAGVFSPPSNPGEIEPFSIDFAAQLFDNDAILFDSITTELFVVTGTDPTPSLKLIGPPLLTGTVVSQNVGGLAPNALQPGTVYSLVFTVQTASGRVLINSAHIACVAIE